MLKASSQASASGAGVAPLRHRLDENPRAAAVELTSDDLRKIDTRRTEMKKLLAATVMSLCLLASTCAHVNQARAASGSGAPAAASSGDSQTISIARSGSHPSAKGPAEYFTGSVRIDPLFNANDRQTSVTFVPGARTA